MVGPVPLLVLLCVVMIIVSLVGIAAPRSVWRLTAWRFRYPDRMEPTPRQYRVRRVQAASLLTLFLPVLIAVAWPGDFRVRITVWGVASIASALLLVLVTIAIWLLLRNRFAPSDEQRPSELGGPGYGLEWFQIVYTLVYVVVVVLVVTASVAAVDRSAEEARARNERTLSPEAEEEIRTRVENLLPTRPALVETPYSLPVVAAVPDGAVLGPANRAETAGEQLTVYAPTRGCAPSALLVVESTLAVQVDVVYPVASLDLCGSAPARGLDAISVTLSAPVGERALLHADDTRLPR